MRSKGITLIALVITVIILLILAGITISELTGSGLFSKAKQAANEAKYANAAEKVVLAVNASYDTTGKLNDEELKKNLNSIEGIYPKVTDVSYDLEVTVDGYKFKISSTGKITGEKTQVATLPENSKNTNAGTEVRPEVNWNTQVVSYIKTTDGTEVTTLDTVATIYAISDGQNNTIPVPNGFYYVGGTKDSGVVISDDERDKNKYAGIEDVPAGAIYNNDGTVKTYTDDEYNKLSADEKRAILMGNQFIWIPCAENEYVKKDWGINLGEYESQTNIAELIQIQKYGGFYIGRYEAGTSNIKLSTKINFAVENTAYGWCNDDFSIRDDLKHTTTGKVTLKAGEIPYYHADYETAFKLSKEMYQTDYVQSGLPTGTMWDAMLKFIAGNNNSIATSSSWGNYIDGKVTYKEGQGRVATVDGSDGSNEAFIKCDGTTEYQINTTAISESVKKKNLYDVAGNLWEITQEASYYEGQEEYFMRSGCFMESYKNYPAGARQPVTLGYTSTDVGFRPVLYIK